MAEPAVAHSTLLASERTYRVHHRTTYTYSTTVIDAYSVTNLLPRRTPSQEVLSARIVTDPEVDELDERLDVFGNRVVQMGLHRPHDRFEVIGESEVIAAPVRIAPPGPPSANQLRNKSVTSDCESGPSGTLRTRSEPSQGGRYSGRNEHSVIRVPDSSSWVMASRSASELLSIQ